LAGKRNGNHWLSNWENLGHWGTYDFQRENWPIIWAQYFNASNFAVGAYMNGANATMQDAENQAANYASVLSSNKPNKKKIDSGWNYGSSACKKDCP
jgi:hypothetical protein